METHINIEVQCFKPSWVSYEKNKYRLYVNQDLVTERDWRWDLNTVIYEDVWVNIEPGIHSIRLEPILQANSVAEFGLRNFKLDNWPKPDQGGDKLELYFRVE